jgi:N-dimethylarginine dimethylaminohydrolase
MNLVVNLRKIAIKNCLSDDIDVYIERAYRHYSKTYNTPLHLAHELVTVPDALLIYMEDQMEDYTKEDLQERLAELTDKKPSIMLEPPKYANPRNELLSDDDAWIAEMNRKLREEEAQKAKAKVKDAEKLEAAAKDAINQLAKSVNKILKD